MKSTISFAIAGTNLFTGLVVWGDNLYSSTLRPVHGAVCLSSAAGSNPKERTAMVIWEVESGAICSAEVEMTLYPDEITPRLEERRPLQPLSKRDFTGPGRKAAGLYIN